MTSEKSKGRPASDILDNHMIQGARDVKKMLANNYHHRILRAFNH